MTGSDRSASNADGATDPQAAGGSTAADDLSHEVAYAMEAPEELLPHLAFLLQDLPSLSGAEDEVVDALRAAGFPRGGTVLDLGCGRGDIAVNVAAALGATVTGIDAHAPFIEIARHTAASRELADRCSFEASDLRKALDGPPRFDAVLMIAVGPLLGDPAATVAALRGVVRADGWIVVDDGYLEDGVGPSPDWEGYTGRAETEAGLTRHGDEIVDRRSHSPSTRTFNALALERIPVRATQLAQRHPELRAALDAYIERQIKEVEAMEGPVVSTMWVLRKRGRGTAD